MPAPGEHKTVQFRPQREMHPHPFCGLPPPQSRLNYDTQTTTAAAKSRFNRKRVKIGRALLPASTQEIVGYV